MITTTLTLIAALSDSVFAQDISEDSRPYSACEAITPSASYRELPMPVSYRVIAVVPAGHIPGEGVACESDEYVVMARASNAWRNSSPVEAYSRQVDLDLCTVDTAWRGEGAAQYAYAPHHNYDGFTVVGCAGSEDPTYLTTADLNSVLRGLAGLVGEVSDLGNQVKANSQAIADFKPVQLRLGLGVTLDPRTNALAMGFGLTAGATVGNESGQFMDMMSMAAIGTVGWTLEGHLGGGAFIGPKPVGIGGDAFYWAQRPGLEQGTMMVDAQAMGVAPMALIPVGDYFVVDTRLMVGSYIEGMEAADLFLGLRGGFTYRF